MSGPSPGHDREMNVTESLTLCTSLVTFQGWLPVCGRSLE
jgi:hypothetical protein